MTIYARDPSSSLAAGEGVPMLSAEPDRRQIEIDYYVRLLEAEVIDPVAAEFNQDWERMQNPRLGWLADFVTTFLPKRSGFGRF